MYPIGKLANPIWILAPNLLRGLKLHQTAQGVSRKLTQQTSLSARQCGRFDAHSCLPSLGWGTSSLISPRTKASVPTIGCMQGTAFQSTGVGTQRKLLRYRTCSTNDRTRRTICLPCVATSRTMDSGCAAVLTRRIFPLQARDPKRQISWCRSQPNLFSHG
jgi:hypothetical protein